MPILLFDGVCNLCNGFVDFIIKRDPEGNITFGALQSEEGKKLVEERGIPTDLHTVVLIDGDRFYTKSTAALLALRHLHSSWKLLVVFIAVPRFIRDLVYDYVVKHRYKWFGKRTCRVPTAKEKKRFL